MRHASHDQARVAAELQRAERAMADLRARVGGLPVRYAVGSPSRVVDLPPGGAEYEALTIPAGGRNPALPFDGIDWDVHRAHHSDEEYAWDMEIDETTDWTAVEFLRMFQEAIQERWLPHGPVTNAPYPDEEDFVQEGDAVAPVIRSIQLNAMNLYLAALDPAFAFHDLAMPGGIIPDDSPAWIRNSQPVLSVVAGGPQFERRRPREITRQSAAFDSQSNPAADGQRAYVYRVPGVFGTGTGPWWTKAHPDDTQIAERIDGVWTHDPLPQGVRAIEDMPDMLSSYAASPNTVSANARGELATGDYVGPWIFRQTRDVLNASRRFRLSTSLWTWQAERRRGFSPTLPSLSLADAKAMAEASYADASFEVRDKSEERRTFAQLRREIVGDTRYIASVQRWRARVAPVALGRSAGLRAFTLEASADGDFANFGDPVIAGRLSQAWSGTASTVPELLIATGSEVIPAWPADPPPPASPWPFPGSPFSVTRHGYQFSTLANGGGPPLFVTADLTGLLQYE